MQSPVRLDRYLSSSHSSYSMHSPFKLQFRQFLCKSEQAKQTFPSELVEI